ncbi:MAG: beta-N-acetylhexosaminidase [Chloroflexi bacterium]|nr:beta-N-acetylhexosaminidase [Chloroflexota bacterium]
MRCIFMMKKRMGYLRRIALLTTVVAVLSPGARPTHAAIDSPEARVGCAFQRLDARSKAGQLFMVSVDGAVSSRHMADLLRTWRAGGIILFSRNISTARNLQALIANAQRASAVPLLVATDQEGGPVVRIRVGVTPLPAPAYYGALGSADKVYADSKAQGLALKALGINLNLAPVVDVRVTSSSAIGRRSFGPDPALDASLAVAAIRGYQAAGIGATAKHFLGLGEVQLNADLALPVVHATRAQLEARDMPPMRAAIRAGVAALMVTRVVIPAFDKSNTAAYASPLMVSGIIRGELGYTGAVITDSLLSPAVMAGPGPLVAARAAIRAGDDILLLGGGEKEYEATIGSVIAAVDKAVALGDVPASRLNDAVLHVLRLKARLGLLPPC